MRSHLGLGEPRRHDRPVSHPSIIFITLLSIFRRFTGPIWTRAWPYPPYDEKPEILISVMVHFLADSPPGFLPRLTYLDIIRGNKGIWKGVLALPDLSVAISKQGFIMFIIISSSIASLLSLAQLRTASMVSEKSLQLVTIAAYPRVWNNKSGISS